MSSVPPSEAAYDRMRMRQWSRGRARSAGIDRRDLLRLVAAASVAAPLVPGAAAPARAAAGTLAGVVKPLPPELFTVRGTNAETRFEALRGTGLLTPADRFFVRNHTATPRIDAADWTLTVWGSGLAGGPVDFTYDALRALPSVTRTAFVECAGNGRSYFASQQGGQVSGTAWTLGAIGTARWRGCGWPTCCGRQGSPGRRSTCSRAVWTPRSSVTGRIWAGCADRCRWRRPWTTCSSPTR